MKVGYNRAMVNLLLFQAEAYSRESFHCSNCREPFEAKVITWVDVSKTPRARKALMKWQFNLIQCTHCGCRHFSGTPFFYEDFEQGLLIAVFPSIPEDRGTVEKTIRLKYGYYPVLEFFYDMTQIWMLLYFQEHYKMNKNLGQLSRIGKGEKQLRTMLQFLKENPLMIDIREKLTESFFEEAGSDQLLDILGRAIYTLEKMLPWPLDHRCLCGADLATELKCCGQQISIGEHQQLLSQHYVVYCNACKEPLSGAACENCGRVFTWKLGTIASFSHNDSAYKNPSAVQWDREI